MGTFLTELEALYGDIVMWKYLIQDLLGTVKYAPYGILIGCLLYCLLLVVRKKNNVENKKCFSFWTSKIFLKVPVMIIPMFIHFIRIKICHFIQILLVNIPELILIHSFSHPII